MARIFAPEQLPHLKSTRDRRKRIDLVNESLQGTKAIRGDMIVYPPDNIGSKHYHKGAHEFKYVLRGSSIYHIGNETITLRAGHIIFMRPGEVHYMETSPDEDVAFVEFWLPSARDTVWVNPEDP